MKSGPTILLTFSIFISITSGLEICKTQQPCSHSTMDDVVILNCNRAFRNNPNILSSTTLECNKKSKINFILLNNNIDIDFLDKVTFTNIRTLDLSRNKIQKSNHNISRVWPYLEEINVSFNHLEVLDVDFIMKFPSLKSGNWSNNVISIIKPSTLDTSVFLSLTKLDLSGNKLTYLTGSTFKSFSQLKSLDLSLNLIGSIEKNTFIELRNLKSLYLKNNLIKTVKDWTLPQSLEHLDLGNKQFHEIHVNSLIISANYNSLDDLFSENSILTSLKVLDISYNNFTSIPNSLSNKNYPKLYTLDLSGNPIANLSFPSKLSVNNLVMTNMGFLEKLNDNVFQNITPRTELMIQDRLFGTKNNSPCMNIILSSNKHMKTINEHAFYNANFNICNLDLSDNGLNKICLDSKKFNWNGTIINLRNNVLVCDCSVLHVDFIQRLIETNTTSLVNFFDCSRPVPYFKPYTWSDYNENELKSINVTIHINEKLKSYLLIIVGVTSMILTIAIIFIIVVYTRRTILKKRHQNRRF